MTSVPLVVQALRDFPTVTGGVSEGGDSHAPLFVWRAAEKPHSPFLQFTAHRIHIVYPDAELEARASIGTRDDSRLDKCGRFRDLKQVDDQVVELHCDGDFVLMDDLDVEDVLVERLRLMQVLHEQAHRADLLQ